ncbi:MAG: cytochrome b/b6 domain-containing protein [Rhodospirillales bacterium]|nr:cytochrome b/b6 domain-containing protein [Rhodospirillales bacterium]
MEGDTVEVGQAQEVKVWDPALRLFHWLLAGSVFGAALTGFLERRLQLGLHLAFGTSIGALLLFRLIWGFFGPTYARFASFLHPPGAVIEHLRELRHPRPVQHLGHNPLGALMVFGLFTVLAALVGTGLVVLGGMLAEGPVASFTSYAVGRPLLFVHGGLAVLLVLMIAGHLGGVAFESRRGEHLVRAMISGAKRVGPRTRWAQPAQARPFAAAAVLVAGLFVSAAGIAALSALPDPRVPPVPASRKTHAAKAYARECSACHMAYPPELLPARSWAAIMGGLSHHFGEDASLGSRRETAAISAYLIANAAAHWDTLPAHLFRVVDPAQPLLISATPAWRRLHRHIPPAVFHSKAVGSPAACDACHRDAATGLFAPQNIHIPKKAMP